MRALLSSRSTLVVALVVALSVAAAPAPPSPDFSDVPGDHPFHEEIRRLVELGIVTGFDDDGTDPEFRPYLQVTRQAVVQLLWVAAGRPVDESHTEPFVDVEDDHPFIAALRWAWSTGLTEGFDEDGDGEDIEFRPTEGVSRQALAAFLHRLSGSTGEGVKLPFADVGEGGRFHDAIAWAFGLGITRGYDPDGDGANVTFRPTDGITRQALAAMLARALAEGVFDDVDGTPTLTVTPSRVRVMPISSSLTGDEGANQYSVGGLQDGLRYELVLLPSEHVSVGDVVRFADADADGEADSGPVAGVLERLDGVPLLEPASSLRITASGDGATFTVDAVSPDGVVPVLFLDRDGDGTLGVDSAGAATEPFGVGGVSQWYEPSPLVTPPSITAMFFTHGLSTEVLDLKFQDAGRVKLGDIRDFLIGTSDVIEMHFDRSMAPEDVDAWQFAFEVQVVKGVVDRAQTTAELFPARRSSTISCGNPAIACGLISGTAGDNSRLLIELLPGQQTNVGPSDPGLRLTSVEGVRGSNGAALSLTTGDTVLDERDEGRRTRAAGPPTFRVSVPDGGLVRTATAPGTVVSFEANEVLDVSSIDTVGFTDFRVDTLVGVANIGGANVAFNGGQVVGGGPQITAVDVSVVESKTGQVTRIDVTMDRQLAPWENVLLQQGSVTDLVGLVGPTSDVGRRVQRCQVQQLAGLVRGGTILRAC